MRVNSLKDSRNASFPTACTRTESTSRLLLRILLGRIWGFIPAELYNHKSSARNGTAELCEGRIFGSFWSGGAAAPAPQPPYLNCRRRSTTKIVTRLPQRNIQLPKPVLAGCDSGTRMV